MSFLDEKISHLAATVALEGQRTREAFATGLAETKEGLRVTGARYVRPAVGRVTGAPGRLVGWSLLSTAAASIVLHDGATADDDVIAVITLTAGVAQTITAPAPGVSYVHGLFAEVTGTAPVTGALWIGSQD